MADSLRLEVLLEAVDKATAPLKRVTQSSKQAAVALKDLTDKQRELRRIQNDVASYQKNVAALDENKASLEKVSASLQVNREALDAARNAQRSAQRETKSAEQEYQRLSNKVINSSQSNQELSRQLEQARIKLEQMQGASSKAASQADTLAQKVKVARDEQYRLNASTERITGNIGIYAEKLKTVGIDTQQLSTVSASLKTREDALTDSIVRQKEQLEALKVTQDRVTSAREQYQKSMSARNNLAVTGIGSEIAGERIRTFLTPAVQEAEKFQNQEVRISALGQGTAQTQAAINYANSHQAYGVSQTDDLGLVRDGMTVFGSEAKAQQLEPILARMKFSNDTLFGAEQGEDRERLFMDMMKAIELRGGVNNPAEFKRQANMIQQVINASGGRVNADEWLQVIKTGSIAVRGMDDSAFYYKLEPMIQELGGQRVGTSLMSLYQNLYQGRTTKVAAARMEQLGLIGDRSKVTFDKVGQQAFVGPGALLDGDLFKRDMFGWVDKVLIPQLKKNGMTSRNQIMDAVGSIITNRTAAGIVSSYIMQQQANQRRARLNARADNIDTMYSKARQMTQGTEVNLAARRADLYKTMGDNILPTYTRALEAATNAIVKLNHFMQENPRVAHAMLVGLAGLGILLGVSGAITVAMAAMWGPLALVRFGMKSVGISIGVAAKSGGILTRVLSRLGRVLEGIRVIFDVLKPIVTSVAMLIGRTFVRSVLAAGRAFLVFMAASPILLAIGLIIAGIAFAAYEVYRHWDVVSRFFIRMWGDIKTAAGDAWDYIKRTWEGAVGIASGIWGRIRAAFHGGIRSIAALLINWSPTGLLYKGFALLMQYLGEQVPNSLTAAGVTMMHALGDGISKGFTYVQKKVQATWQWIKSVIPGLGDSTDVNIKQTTAQGDERARRVPQKTPVAPLILKKAALVSAMSGALAGPALANPNADQMVHQHKDIQFDTAPPVSSRTQEGRGDDNRQYFFTIHAAPGMDAKEVATQVQAHLDKHEQQQKARQRASLMDRH
ncbi:hypothetical protein LMG33818_002612 [Halomonadaceae bacterium LMG 33818]|uniref:hypothetical protein n=1 Tax=Cernens ardua TaxID=3402176 RepID=UPI003EDC32F4